MPVILDQSQPTITHEDLMLATPGKLASWKGWIYELKYAGFRCLTRRSADRTMLLSRRGRDMAGFFLR